MKERTSVYKRGDNLDSVWRCRIGVDLWNGIFWASRRFEPSKVGDVRHMTVWSIIECRILLCKHGLTTVGVVEGSEEIMSVTTVTSTSPNPTAHTCTKLLRSRCAKLRISS